MIDRIIIDNFATIEHLSFDLGSGFRAPDGLCEMTGGLATPWRGAVCITEASSRLCFCPLPLSSGPRRLLLGEAGRSPNPSLVLPDRKSVV